MAINTIIFESDNYFPEELSAGVTVRWCGAVALDNLIPKAAMVR